MTILESHLSIGIPIPPNQNDKRFGEEIVELFTAHANALCQVQGLSTLSVGALASPCLSVGAHVGALASST
jgi:hypothetical protein